jgi:carbon-monoxide dehydrogenase large subunit
VKWTCDRTEAFLSDAHGRDHVTHAELAIRRRGQDPRAMRVHTTANLGAYHVALLVAVPTYLYATLLSGQYDIPAIYARSRRSTPIPRRSMPIAAPAGRRRPIVVERLMETAARQLGKSRSAAAAPEELRQEVPAPDAGDHDVRHRRLRAPR